MIAIQWRVRSTAAALGNFISWLRSWQKRHQLKSCLLSIIFCSALFATSESQAAITFVAASANAPNATSTTFALTAPAGIVAGDVLLAQIAATGGSNITVTAPAGWTLISRLNSGTALLQGIYYKVASAADSGAIFTWTLSASQKSTGGIVAYRGVNNIEPIDAAGGQVNAASTSVTAPSVTTTSSNAMLVGFFGLGTAQAAFNVPGTMVERYDVSSNALPGTGSAAADAIQAAPGASGAQVATTNNKTAVNIGHLVALRASASLLADYHFDECTYTGAAGEVIDATGSYNATAKNSLNTGTPGIVQRYGNFNTYATYAQTAIPIPGEWSLSVWFKLPFLSTQQYHVIGAVAGGGDLLYLDANDGLRWGVYTPSATIPGTFKFNTLASGWHFMTVVGVGAGTRLYIDGVLKDTVTNNKAKGTLTYLGTSYDSVNTAAAQGFGAPLDEMRVYLNPLTQTEITTVYNNQLAGKNADGSTRTGGGCINHFAISHSGTGVNCQAEPVTITAHDAAHNPIAANGTVVGISTSLGHGDWTLQTGSGTLLNSGGGAATYTFGNETSVVLLLKDTFAETVNINLNAGGITEAATEDPALAFAASGFRFLDAANVATIANQTAAVTSATYYLQAIRTDTNTGACVGVFNNQTVNIELASQCNDPITCAGQQVTYNGTTATTIAANPNSGVTTYTAKLLTFLNDGTSRTSFTFSYPDVGKISLYARYNIPRPDGSGSGNYMLGASNPFVVKPDHFDISAIKCTTANAANCGAGALAMPTAGDNPAAAGAGGASFIQAGNAFTLTVTARNDVGGATPNFGKEVTAEGVILTPALVLPAGGNTPTLSNGSLDSFTGGVATATNLSLDEVGIITLTPNIADGNYLGAGNVSGTTSGNIGRFFPHHFVMSAPLIKTRSDLTCAPASSFTYMGETFNVSFKLVGQNLANGSTKNYIGSFVKLDAATAANWTSLGSADSIGLGAVNTASNTALSARLGVSNTSGTWTAATGGALAADVTLARQTAPDGPYATMNVGIAPKDTDGVQLLPGALNLDANVDAVNERQLLQSTEIRYGRLRLNNAIGSERLPLPVPFKAQYFNGLGFITNLADSCTAFSLAPKTDNSPSNIQYGSLLVNNPLGGMTVGASDLTAIASVQIAAGLANLILPAPNLSGSIDLTLTVPTWLQYNWTGVMGNPRARVSFGRFRNTGEFIYQRENY